MGSRRFSTLALDRLRQRIVQTDPLIARLAATRARASEPEEERDEIVEELLDPALPFKRYASIVNPDYRWYRHVDVLAERLQAVADDELFRLMVFMPPRHGKTWLVSNLFPAYYLRRHPKRWFALSSYGAQLAEINSSLARDYYTRGGGRLKGETRAKQRWETLEGGGLWAAGVGGAATGQGFDCGVIDDPVKSKAESLSETIRERDKRWYGATWYSRRQTKHAALILQMTRWHSDDLAGALLADEEVEPEHWHIVSFDALHEERQQIYPVTCTVEPDWRKPGQALCPERFDEEALRKIKARPNSDWLALYQQRPVAAGGNVFKEEWWQFYDIIPPKFHEVLLSIDCSFKDERDSDYVVMQAWGRVRADNYLLDQVRARLDFPATLAGTIAMVKKWPQASAKLIEDKANGPAVIATLRKKIGGIIPVDPEGGKLVRGHAIAPYVESGNFYLPAPDIANRRAAEWREVARKPNSWLSEEYVRGDWVSAFIAEHTNFPRGAYDDQVDATTQAGIRLVREKPTKPPPPPDKQARSLALDAIESDY